MTQVLVLNASYEPLNVTSVRRAHVLVFKGKAEVIEELEQPLRSASSTYPWPHVIRLVQYVKVPRAVQRKISRRALFARDGWRCVYCGTTSGRLTLDHVVPRSRGGDLRLGERRHLVCAVQPEEGEPVTRGGFDGAAPAPEAAAAGALHPPGRAEDPARLAPVSARPRRLDRLVALDRKVGALFPFAPRAGVELRVPAGEGQAVHGDGRRDAGAAVGDDLARG